MAVNLTLTAEQAALLVPLLQQISGPNSTSVATATDSSADPAARRSLFSPPSTPASALTFSMSSDLDGDSVSAGNTSASEFTTDELLVRKKRNSKATSAQTYLLVSEVMNM